MLTQEETKENDEMKQTNTLPRTEARQQQASHTDS